VTPTTDISGCRLYFSFYTGPAVTSWGIDGKEGGGGAVATPFRNPLCSRSFSDLGKLRREIKL
jgi:hypothetical protein